MTFDSLFPRCIVCQASRAHPRTHLSFSPLIRVCTDQRRGRCPFVR